MRIVDSRSVWQRVLSVVLMGLLVWTIVSPVPVSAVVGIGGLIGQKVLGNGTSSVEWLGDGTHSIQVLMSAPVATTLPATNNLASGGGHNATLNGNLVNLNGMPRATVYFQWGYGPALLINNTPNQTVTTTGTKSANVTGLVSGLQVYYRIVAVTDGTTIGSTVTFIAGGGAGASKNVLSELIPLVVAASILIFVWLRWNNLPLALVGAIVGFVALRITLALIQTVFT